MNKNLLKTLGPNQPNLSHIYHIHIRGNIYIYLLELYYDPKRKFKKSIKLINNFCFQILLKKLLQPNLAKPTRPWQNQL